MINNQFHLFLIFILNGLIIGLIFDFFRILRKTIKTSDIITHIEDFLFWMLTGLLILYSIFTFNNGEIRLFMFLAIIVGMLVYFTLISRFVIKVNVTIINFFKKIIIQIINLFKIPINFILNLIKKIVFKPITFIIINIRNYFTKLLKNIHIFLKNPKMSNKLMKNSKK